jgi:hypothetical protein
MGLRDRCGGERLWIDAREDVVAEVGADRRVDVDERHRRHLVDELRQLLDVDVGQEIGAGREELPELDVRRPQLLECLAKPPGALARRLAVADGADLGQHPTKAGFPRDLRHLQRTARAVQAYAHVLPRLRVGRPGNTGRPPQPPRTAMARTPSASGHVARRLAGQR